MYDFVLDLPRKTKRRILFVADLSIIPVALLLSFALRYGMYSPSAVIAAASDVLLPVDAVVAREFKAHADHETVPVEDVPPDAMILDAGPETVDRLADALDAARTLVWNGPLGAFELEPFDTATVEAAQYAARRAREHHLVAVAGGGDTVAALNHAGAAHGFTFVSTAGGAFLEWLEGRTLPGVAALREHDDARG